MYVERMFGVLEMLSFGSGFIHRNAGVLVSSVSAASTDLLDRLPVCLMDLSASSLCGTLQAIARKFKLAAETKI